MTSLKSNLAGNWGKADSNPGWLIQCVCSFLPTPAHISSSNLWSLAEKSVFTWVENHFLLDWNKNPCMEVKLNIPILLEKSSTLALGKKVGRRHHPYLFFFLLPSALNNFLKAVVHFSGKTLDCTLSRQPYLLHFTYFFEAVNWLCSSVFSTSKLETWLQN